MVTDGSSGDHTNCTWCCGGNVPPQRAASSQDQKPSGLQREPVLVVFPINTNSDRLDGLDADVVT